MLDLLTSALKLDEFLIALLGHFANEGAAKVTVAAVRAIGVAALGFAFEAREKAQEKQSAAMRTRRRSKHPNTSGQVRRRRGRVTKKAKA